MHSAQDLALNGQYHGHEYVARDLGASHMPDPRIGALRAKDTYTDTAWPREIARRRPPIGRRVLRPVMRFLVTVLFGVGVTLTWQSYGDEAKEMARAFAPSLGWLLPVSAPKSSADPQAAAGTGTTVDLLEQLNPLLLNVATLRSSLQQVATAQEQLAAKQEQIMQNITALQDIVQQSVRPRVSPPPRARAPLPLSTGQASAPLISIVGSREDQRAMDHR